MYIKKILTSNQYSVLNILKNVAEQNNEIIRINGGMVRDICNIYLDNIRNNTNNTIQTNDIDLSTQNYSGIQFANYIKQYAEQHNHIFKIYTPLGCKKSSHLKTAKCKLNGIEIDIVQLRSELYENKSRIPLIKTANVVEDAYRRDFTINSMFINIMNWQIEDYTNGLYDLMEKKICCPKNVIDTMMDDPFRIFRLIKIKIKFNDFTFSPDIVLILHNIEILKDKFKLISRQHINTEIKLLVSLNMRMYMDFLYEYPEVFSMIYDVNKNYYKLCKIIDIDDHDMFIYMLYVILNIDKIKLINKEEISEWKKMPILCKNFIEKMNTSLNEQNLTKKFMYICNILEYSDLYAVNLIINIVWFKIINLNDVYKYINIIDLVLKTFVYNKYVEKINSIVCLMNYYIKKTHILSLIESKIKPIQLYQNVCKLMNKSISVKYINKICELYSFFALQYDNENIILLNISKILLIKKN
jgi:tRNA nucleotidyltransferase/poly(A) polymerase